jgi:hypothetical protein
MKTCDGDPAAAERALREAGLEATVNIVGFALEDPALKAEMASWAAAGGGTFFDAQDQDALLAGVTAALLAPFRVYDQDGALAAVGVVGGPEVELPPGIYRVEVLSDPPAAFGTSGCPSQARSSSRSRSRLSRRFWVGWRDDPATCHDGSPRIVGL